MNILQGLRGKVTQTEQQPTYAWKHALGPSGEATHQGEYMHLLEDEDYIQISTMHTTHSTAQIRMEPGPVRDAAVMAILVGWLGDDADKHWKAELYEEDPDIGPLVQKEIARIGWK
jgi:hypothetical protein